MTTAENAGYHILTSPTAEDIERPSEVDAGFVLQIFDKEVENVLKIARSPGHPSQHLVPAEPFFRCKYIL